MSPPHSHSHSEAGSAGHHHAAAAPHPSQSPPWSILRMTVAARLGVALVMSAMLWAFVLTAMR
ncbi:hypothetical protein HNR60_004007 [Rhodopseudomonas rhenobacensis]|uniref:Uncharacterized protein n=1 Tax=Rhodopseudomonas rhenobacensis TaxID=87461 RepID=A0A7W8E0S8_9BRAD|nr:hypothetical protein [Rhodopseudomonas rhenobacensis]MBB5049232.1 hypothetical protein [Rhodopseudomonas rhenobacensis]